MADKSVDAHELLFGVRRSVRYHARRRRFFDTLAKCFTVFTAIGGVGTFTTLLTKAPDLVTLLYGAATAIFSTIDLVVGCAEKARTHSDLMAKFIQLERDMVKAGEKVSDEALVDFKCQRLVIEENEPTILRVLDILCHNELCRALGYDKCEFYKVSRIQRFFAQVCDFGFDRIEKDKG